MQLRNVLAAQARPRATTSLPRSSTRGRPRHVCAAETPQRRSRSPQDKLKKPSSSSANAATTLTTASSSSSPSVAASSSSAAGDDDGDSAALPAAYTLITDDPDQLAQEIKSLQLENERTREALRVALAESERTVAEATKASSPSPPSSSSSPAASVAAASASAHSLSIEGARADDVDAELSWVLGGAPPSVAKPATASFATFDESSSDEEEAAAAAASPAPEAPQHPPASPPAARTKVTDVVFVTAEAAPFSKTGGLGDVLGALPRAMAARAAAAAAEAAASSSSSSSSPPPRGLGGRVMVVLPRYMQGSAADDVYAAARDTGVSATLNLGNCGPQQVRFFHQRSEEDNVDWVFVDHPSYHRAGNPYGDAAGVFGDNQFRFSLLSLAALEAPLHLPELGFGREFKSDDEKRQEGGAAASSSSSSSSEEPSVDALCRPFGSRPCTFVANDWHAGLVPLYLAHKFRPFGVYADARALFVIHNLSHQGVEPAHTFDALGFPGETAWRARDQLSWEYPSWASITGDAVNILKGAVLSSDRILTVSSGYAWEVQTPEGGWGLHEVLRQRSGVLNGVTNGINVGEWDPSRDAALPFNYSAADLSGKAKCKAALQEELGLKVDASVPLVGWIGRLDYQKGPDLLLAALGELVARNIQVVMLGSGSASLENDMRAAEARFPDHFRGWVGFSVPVSHRITAGADVILMNSRFEPCGLNQLHAAAYGTPVVAHATGGLRDTILDAGRLAPPGGSGDDDDELLKSAAAAAAASSSSGSNSAASSSPPSSILTAEQVGTGWLFSPPETQPMLQAVDAALHTWRHRPRRWAAMQRAAMLQDLSWAKAADEYATVIEWAHIDPPTVQ